LTNDCQIFRVANPSGEVELKLIYSLMRLRGIEFDKLNSSVLDDDAAVANGFWVD
jgi:hypothetical protein